MNIPSKTKLNWFSPLPPTKTKITEYTKQLLPSLSKHADIVLWTEQEFWDSQLEDFAQVYHYNPHTIPWNIIHEGDMNLYHLDNNPHFQTTIWNISRYCPGLVILHEANLHNCFALSHVNIYRDLTTLALENSIGVIVHNPTAYHLLKQDQSRLTAYIPLPFWQQQDQVDNYVKTVLDFADMTKPYRPYPLTNQLVEKVAQEMRFLSNDKSLKYSLQTVTNALDFLIS